MIDRMYCRNCWKELVWHWQRIARHLTVGRGWTHRLTAPGLCEQPQPAWPKRKEQAA